MSWNLKNFVTGVSGEIDKHVNTTKVNDQTPYSRGDDGSGYLGAPGWPTCAGSPCTGTDCGPWYPAQRPTGSIYNQIFEKSGTITIDPCADMARGWRGVMSRKVWHGRFGFLSHDLGGNYDNQFGCACEAYQGTADQTKYCAVAGTGTYQYSRTNCFGLQAQYSGAFSCSSSVNKTSGVVTRTSYVLPTLAIAGTATADWDDDYKATLLSTMTETTRSLATGWMGASKASILALLMTSTGLVGTSGTWDIRVDTDSAGNWVVTSTEYTVDGMSVKDSSGNTMATAELSGTEWTIKRYQYPTGTALLVEEISIDWKNGNYSYQKWTTFSRYEISEDGEGCSPVENGSYVDTSYLETCEITNTSITYSKLTRSEASGNFTVQTYAGTVGLSDQYLGSDVIAQINGLLDYWPLSDRRRYPSRSDGYVTTVPVLSYAEQPSPSSPADANFTEAEWTDPEAVIYTGTVMGIPLQVGYDHAFEWDHQNWLSCITDSQTYRWVESWGAWSGVGGIPDAATAWTNAGPTFPFGAMTLPGPGPFFVGQAGVYVRMKWYESQIPAPGFNWGRPWGGDRLLIDETRVACIESASGSAVPYTVTLVSAFASSVADGTACAVTGVDGVPDGSYSVIRIDDTHYRLTAALDYEVASTSEAIIAPLRYPECPAIQGAPTVTSVETVGSTTVIGLSKRHYLFLTTSESVVISGLLGCTDLNGTQQATRIDNTHFSIPIVSANAWTSGGTVTSAGAPDARWDSRDSNGDFFTIDYTFDQRDWQEWERCTTDHAACALAPAPEGVEPRAAQASIGVNQSITGMTATQRQFWSNSCAPAGVYSSPNNEGFGDGVIALDLPAIPGLDDRYGVRAQMLIIQWMQDLLWQQPHAPCDLGTSDWQEDTGAGTYDTDGVKYYAQRPWVEARCTLPTRDGETAPSRWEDLIHVCSQVEADSTPVGKVVVPSDTIGETMSCWTPWETYALELACICQGHNFSVTYAEQQKIVCTT